ncbi:hypothetical protein AGR1B_Lc50434 [Agrobacterium fabacearum S56]|nr:hypothetical protein AGR1B_Lc50434 [Agrobacterium fabacearum S56]
MWQLQLSCTTHEPAQVWQPYFCGGQHEKGSEGFLGFGVSGSDATKLLEPVEQPLNAVSVPLGSEVTGGRVFAVGPRRDDEFDPVDQQLFAQSVAVIALARNSLSLPTGIARRSGTAL